MEALAPLSELAATLFIRDETFLVLFASPSEYDALSATAPLTVTSPVPDGGPGGLLFLFLPVDPWGLFMRFLTWYVGSNVPLFTLLGRTNAFYVDSYGSIATLLCLSDSYFVGFAFRSMLLRASFYVLLGSVIAALMCRPILGTLEWPLLATLRIS